MRHLSVIRLARGLQFSVIVLLASGSAVIAMYGYTNSTDACWEPPGV